MNSQREQRRTLYRGRFAPSPTGPLHFGSLVAALGSYLQARSQGGEWLVRIEDIDPPREVPGAADDILRTLEALHLHWDGPVLYQSQRHPAYEEALDQLAHRDLSFPCACSRKIISNAVSKYDASKNTPVIYPGTCRNGMPPRSKARSIRLRVDERSIVFQDHLQGRIETRLDKEVGDFVIKRADGFYAYHLAVVVDDAFQGITEIVRGIDLVESTPHHIYLQQLLGFPTPGYAHLPVAVNEQGEKLSKQTHADPVDTRDPGQQLARALSFLGHKPGADVISGGPEGLLEWAVSRWDLENIPHDTAIEVKHEDPE